MQQQQQQQQQVAASNRLPVSQRNRAMQSQLRLMHAVQENSEFGYREAPQLFGPSLHSLPPFPPANPQNPSLSSASSPPAPPPGYSLQSNFNPHGNTRGNTNVSAGILCGLGLPEPQPTTQGQGQGQGQGIEGQLSVFADYTRQQYDQESQNNTGMSSSMVGGNVPSVNSRDQIYSMRDQSPLSLSHLDQMKSHQGSISSSSGDRYSNPANDLNIFVPNQSTSSELNLAMSSHSPHSFVDDASSIRPPHSTSESIIITSPSLFHSPSILGEPRSVVPQEEEFTPSQLQQQQLRQVLICR